MIVGKVNMRYVAFVAVVAAVGGFLFGYDTAVISRTIDTVAASSRWTRSRKAGMWAVLWWAASLACRWLECLATASEESVR